MEKIIYALWDAKPDKVKGELPAALRAGGAQNIRINLQDDAVAAGEALIQRRDGDLPNVIVQCWLRSANPIFRKACDRAVAGHCDSFHAWLVTESTIISNEAHPPAPGARCDGFAQMAFLTKPEGQSWEDWRAVWRDYHTQVAIDTQSNFEYVQNLIVEPLTDGAPKYVAIVEECFPIEALSDPFVFFDARGADGSQDQEKFDKNLGIMMESCGRFITPGTIDVFPSSQYNF